MAADRPEQPMDRFLRPSSSGGETAAAGFDRHADVPAIMLDLVLKNGDRQAFPYSFLSSVRLDPSGVLTLEYTQVTVTIRGRNLGPLFNGLILHLVRRIAVASSEFDDETAPTWIQDIEISGSLSDDDI